MKVFINDAVYVQKVDLEFYKDILHSLPEFIASKVFENREVNADDYKKYDFFKFEDIKEIEFFRGVDWIIDYEDVRNLNDLEIKEMGKKFVDKRDKLAKRIYIMTPENIDYESVLLEYKLINYQIYSLDDFIDYKSGLLKITFPNEENKFQKLIRKFFVKKNN